MANETSCLEGFSVRAGRPRRESALTQAGVWPAPVARGRATEGRGCRCFFPAAKPPCLSPCPPGEPGSLGLRKVWLRMLTRSATRRWLQSHIPTDSW